MAIAILATGDEIVHGDTLNTNSKAIAHALSSEGLLPGLQLSCSDNEQEMLSCLAFLCQKHDIVILTGGLGPTSDDRTRFALARFLNVALIEFPEAVTHIEARLVRANLNFNSGNRQQALFPADATLLPNPHGTAMGCYFRSQDTLFVLLPGPPRECLPMFNEHVLPVLQTTQHTDKHLLKWRLFGVAEGAIAATLDSALATVNCETGYRLETPYVEFKVRCVKEEIEKVKQIVEPLIHAHIIAPPEQKASERLREKIEQMQRSVVVIDDATGGLLQTLLQRPSTYSWLNFYETNTRDTLFFHVSGLKEYWAQQSGATTDITIKYHNDVEHGSETHQMPYRSPLVVEYAAEWLSFRLFHLIDQLHQ